MRRRRLLTKKRRNKGTTIVEMLVCFVLLAFLMVAASQFLTSSMRTYSSAKRGLAGREAADLVADHIEGLLESATVKKALQPFTEGNNTQITFWDKQKRKATICCDEEGYLDVIYANGKDGAVHWKFDKGVYRGYKIKEMKFFMMEPAEHEPGTEEYLDPDVYDEKTVQLSLIVQSAENGEYAIDRYIRFGNVK